MKLNFEIFFPDAVLKHLITEFENFTTQCLRKQNIITNIVTDILSEMKSLKKNITELRGQQATCNRTETMTEKLKLPAWNIEELKEIENYLMDQDNFIKTVTVF